MSQEEYEATIWCPICLHEYGQVFRYPVNEITWGHRTRPAVVPKYCSQCECPTERKP